MEMIKKILHYFSYEASQKRYQQKMNDFLSQATDRHHLEALEKEWDRRYYWGSNNLMSR
jgi:hypothetical protein